MREERGRWGEEVIEEIREEQRRGGGGREREEGRGK